MNKKMRATSLLLATLLLLLCGCYTGRKATSQSTKAYTRYPDIVAELYAKWFPIKEKVKERIVYKEGATVYRYDTVTIDCDSALKAQQKDGKPKTNYVRVPCPPCDESKDTVEHYKEVTQESTAALQDEQGKREKVEKKLGDANEKIARLEEKCDSKDKIIGNQRWLIIILLSYMALKIALRLVFPTIAPFIKRLP